MNPDKKIPKIEHGPKMIKPTDVIPYALMGMVQYYSRYLILASHYPENGKYSYLGEGLIWEGEDYSVLKIEKEDILEFVKRYIKELKWDVFADGTSIEDGMRIIEENIKKTD